MNKITLGLVPAINEANITDCHILKLKIYLVANDKNIKLRERNTKLNLKTLFARASNSLIENWELASKTIIAKAIRPIVVINTGGKLIR